MTPTELNHLIQNHAARSHAYTTRLTPGLLILKASLANDDARQLRSSRIERRSLVFTGFLFLFGSTLFDPSTSLFPGLPVALGIPGLGALAWALVGECSFS